MALKCDVCPCGDFIGVTFPKGTCSCGHRKKNHLDLAKVAKAEGKTFRRQMVFFLNAFYDELEHELDAVWGYYEKFVAIDHHVWETNRMRGAGKYHEGHCMDEFNAKRLFEDIGQPMSVVAFRHEFKELDANADGTMSFIEFLLYTYSKKNGCTRGELLRRPQAKSDVLAKAVKELEKAKAQEALIEEKKDKLKAQAAGTGVKANQAKATLAQLNSTDRMGIRKLVAKAESDVHKAKKKSKAARGSVFVNARLAKEHKDHKRKGGIKSKFL